MKASPCGSSRATSLETELARLSGEEMVAALGLARAPAWVRRAGCAAFSAPSRPLSRVLARFDRRIVDLGLDGSAREALAAFGARWSVDAPPPPGGPLLLVSNHPGAYDALALMAAIGRRDLLIVAADRRFLRALPNLSRHLLLVPDALGGGREAPARATAVRRAARHLRAGGALLHFPAGRIEPDPAFLRAREEPLGPWQPGAGALLRATAGAGGRAVAAIVAGVHSARAKALPITWLAERRGVTTLAPLIQVALPGFDDVDVRVRFGGALPARELVRGEGDDARLTLRLREQAAALIGPHARPA